jgi:hypothetical protein
LELFRPPSSEHSRSPRAEPSAAGFSASDSPNSRDVISESGGAASDEGDRPVVRDRQRPILDAAPRRCWTSSSALAPFGNAVCFCVRNHRRGRRPRSRRLAHVSCLSFRCSSQMGTEYQVLRYRNSTFLNVGFHTFVAGPFGHDVDHGAVLHRADALARHHGEANEPGLGPRGEF